MTPLEHLSDEQFKRHAFDMLQRELGIDGLARFLRLYRSGNGDYTRERHKWLQGLRVEDLVAGLDRRTG
jgi:hypothetical protein